MAASNPFRVPVHPISATVRTSEYFGGVPRRVVIENLKAAVNEAFRAGGRIVDAGATRPNEALERST